MNQTLRVAFLGCGFITGVHSRNLKGLRHEIASSYASRDAARAAEFCRLHQGQGSFDSYERAIHDPAIDAVVIAVPPKFHLQLTLEALAAGKHVLVEKPAFLTMDDYLAVRAARDRAGRVVLVGENDHYKPLAVTLRRLLADGAIGDMVFAHFTTHREAAEDRRRLAQRRVDGRRRRLLRRGDPLAAHRRQSRAEDRARVGARLPSAASDEGPDKRAKSMMVAFEYDNGAAGSLYYSREVPSLLKGLRVSKLFGRDGIISFESNGAFLLARGKGMPRVEFPGFRDIRGYQAMYRDFYAAVRDGRQPEMSLERAIEDQVLMDRVYAHAGRSRPRAWKRE